MFLMMDLISAASIPKVECQRTTCEGIVHITRTVGKICCHIKMVSWGKLRLFGVRFSCWPDLSNSDDKFSTSFFRVLSRENQWSVSSHFSLNRSITYNVEEHRCNQVPNQVPLLNMRNPSPSI